MATFLANLLSPFTSRWSGGSSGGQRAPPRPRPPTLKAKPRPAPVPRGATNAASAGRPALPLRSALKKPAATSTTTTTTTTTKPPGKAHYKPAALNRRASPPSSKTTTVKRKTKRAKAPTPAPAPAAAASSSSRRLVPPDLRDLRPSFRRHVEKMWNDNQGAAFLTNEHLLWKDAGTPRTNNRWFDRNYLEPHPLKYYLRNCPTPPEDGRIGAESVSEAKARRDMERRKKQRAQDVANNRRRLVHMLKPHILDRHRRQQHRLPGLAPPDVTEWEATMERTVLVDDEGAARLPMSPDHSVTADQYEPIVSGNSFLVTNLVVREAHLEREVAARRARSPDPSAKAERYDPIGSGNSFVVTNLVVQEADRKPDTTRTPAPRPAEADATPSPTSSAETEKRHRFVNTFDRVLRNKKLRTPRGGSDKVPGGPSTLKTTTPPTTTQGRSQGTGPSSSATSPPTSPFWPIRNLSDRLSRMRRPRIRRGGTDTASPRSAGSTSPAFDTPDSQNQAVERSSDSPSDVLTSPPARGVDNGTPSQVRNPTSTHDRGVASPDSATPRARLHQASLHANAVPPDPYHPFVNVSDRSGRRRRLRIQRRQEGSVGADDASVVGFTPALLLPSPSGSSRHNVTMDSDASQSTPTSASAIVAPPGSVGSDSQPKNVGFVKDNSSAVITSPASLGSIGSYSPVVLADSDASPSLVPRFVDVGSSNGWGDSPTFPSPGSTSSRQSGRQDAGRWSATSIGTSHRKASGSALGLGERGIATVEDDSSTNQASRYTRQSVAESTLASPEPPAIDIDRPERNQVQPTNATAAADAAAAEAVPLVRKASYQGSAKRPDRTLFFPGTRIWEVSGDTVLPYEAPKAKAPVRTAPRQDNWTCSAPIRTPLAERRSEVESVMSPFMEDSSDSDEDWTPTIGGVMAEYRQLFRSDSTQVSSVGNDPKVAARVTRAASKTTKAAPRGSNLASSTRESGTAPDPVVGGASQGVGDAEKENPKSRTRSRPRQAKTTDPASCNAKRGPATRATRGARVPAVKAARRTRRRIPREVGACEPTRKPTNKLAKLFAWTGFPKHWLEAKVPRLTGNTERFDYYYYPPYNGKPDWDARSGVVCRSFPDVFKFLGLKPAGTVS